MVIKEPCHNCGAEKSYARGWDNAPYCSESCERSGLRRLFASMPGGRVPRSSGIPYYEEQQVIRRWEREQTNDR